MEHLGEKIKAERKKLKLSQQEVAALIGSNQGDVSKIEKGQLVGRHLFSYIKFLKKKGVDLNKLF